ncbi:DUF4983 domain-containing protein [Sphingobacterium lumbrici]|uniref:DUF4983 domain-containing protein n=1 Tax=Sphingobacterium lumbrici TaxID=2559600 RepID=UPI001128ED9E|nr:DUF4983 domain-containing protein [Sphingobacterium lumbrici]
MMKNRKRIFGIGGFSFLVCFMLTLMNTSCNQEFINVLPESFKNDTLGVGDGSKRVLYIILDGVKGSVVQSVAPANLTEMTGKAIYTYDGLTDNHWNALTQAGAWTTMLTGVDYTKSHVVTEDFAGFDNAETPTLFTRLKKELTKARTVAITTSPAFADKLATDASAKQTLSDDLGVKNAVVNELSNEDPSLLVAQFSGAELAAANDYSASNVAYTTAITTIDGYIGEILTALRARKTFNGENWLVIVASSKGGGPSGGAVGSNIYDDPSRNIFVTFYNPKFGTMEYRKPAIDGLPYTGTAPRFISTGTGTYGVTNGMATCDDPLLGNFGTSGEFTVMFKMRDDNTNMGNQGWPMYMGKRNDVSSATAQGGWGFLHGGNGGAQFDWSSSPRPQNFLSQKDGKWHTLGMVIYMDGATRKCALYVDGVLGTVTSSGASSNPFNLPADARADNDIPLRLGMRQNKQANLLFKDLVILNVALSPADMGLYMRREFGPTNPYFGNALGWWPANETSGNKMYDHSGNEKHFTFSPAIQFATFSDLTPNISPEISPAAFLVVPNGVDIPVMIYNWMNISVPKEWGLMGKFYNPTVSLPKE